MPTRILLAFETRPSPRAEVTPHERSSSRRARTQKIGVRMAGVGILLGLRAAAALTRLLQRLLLETEPRDPWTFALTALIRLLVASAASYVPARRCTRESPLDDLRTH